MNLLHAVDAADLIAELQRRKRIRVVAVDTTFFNEHSEDANYMRSVDGELSVRIGAGLHNELCITFEDQVLVRDAEARPTKTMRRASVMILASEEADCDEAA